MNDGRPRRGSILDLFLIFLFLFCLLGAFFRWYSLRDRADTESGERLVALLRLREIEPQVAECLTVGEPIYRASGEYFGELSGLGIRPSEVVRIENGNVAEGAWDTALLCDLDLTVSFFGSCTEGRFLHGGTLPLSVGQQITLYTERTELHATIVILTADDIQNPN